MKKGNKPGTPSRKAARGARKTAPKASYPVEPLSVKYCAFRKWKAPATRWQATGTRRTPKEGEWYLMDKQACVASFDFDDGRFTMLKPIREVRGASSRPGARRAKGSKPGNPKATGGKK
jgi:hypothetical protein